MLLPPAGEEHTPELLVEVVLVVNNPDDTVMDDVCHTRPFFVHSICMEKPEMLQRKNFFEKSFRTCNILPFSILMRKKTNELQ